MHKAVAAKTRSAAADTNADQTSPVATRSAVAAKAKTAAISPPYEYLPPLPKIPGRPYGFWNIRTLKPPVGGKTLQSDHEVIDQTIVAVDPGLLPYWGNVDDKSSIHLFDRPMANYILIKLPGDGQFKDTQEVCYYLINFMHY